MTRADSDEIQVIPVKTRNEWNSFHRLPARLRSADSRWVAPLALQSRQTWAPRHPFFRHAEAAAWLARRGGQDVGRISAQVDSLDERQGRPEVGHFGQLEARDQPDVFKALITVAECWLRERDRRVVRGPFDLSINQQCGLLVDGFEHRPMMMMGHHPRYYGPRVEELGFRPAADMLAYRGPVVYEQPESVRRLMRRVEDRVVVRALARNELNRHAETMRQLFNASWAGNWGFIPFTREEFAHMVSEMKPIVRPGYVQMAWLDGDPVGFAVALPDLNELIADLNGRLWPTGALRLLWRLLMKRGSRVRIPLMGVVPRYHGGLWGAGISYALIEALRVAVIDDGVTISEQSWILADNQGMRSIVEAIGMKVAMRYRIYEKELAA